MIDSYIPILNLEHRPKIGNALNTEQLHAIKEFYLHIQENLNFSTTELDLDQNSTPELDLDQNSASEISLEQNSASEQNTKFDQFGIYQEAYQQLISLNIDLNTFKVGETLSDEQRIALANIYRQILAIYYDNKTDIIIPDTDQTKIMQACEKALSILTKLSPEYEAYIKKQQEIEQQRSKQAQKEQEEVFKNQSRSREQILEYILRKAIQDDANYQLTSENVDAIRKALQIESTDWFDFFLIRYNLDKSRFTLDDLRMIIIGVIGNANEQILQSEFIRHLYHVVDLHEKDPAAHFKLTTELNKSLLNYHYQHAIITRLQESSPTDLFDRIINWARSFIPIKWRFIISERLKVNSNFKNDLNTSIISANAKNWQRQQKDGQTPEAAILEQRCASYEYLGHKIAYQNLPEQTIVPIMEPTGQIQYYKKYELFNRDGLTCIALVPANTKQQNLDIKVLFRGTYSIASAIIDIEKYGAGHHSYHEHEGEILHNLNQLIGNATKQANELGQANPSISLTVGGHSLGGALAQNLYSSLIKAKLLPIYNQYHGDHAQLRKLLLPLVKQQIAYETKVTYQDSVKYKDPDIRNNLVEKRIAYLLKSLEKYHLKHQSIDLQQVGSRKKKTPLPTELTQPIDSKNLAQISTINVGTLNSAGISYKAHDFTADGLALLQATNTHNTFHTRFTNIMVGGDIVQQTGQSNISAGLPPEHAIVETVKINADLEGKAKKQALMAAAFEVVKIFATSYLTLKIPYIPWIPGFGDILSSIKKAHCDLHFDDPNKIIAYEYQSNQNDSTIQQVKNLTTKIILVRSKYFQEVKKQLSWIKTAYCKLAILYQAVQGGEYLIRKAIRKIDEWIGLDNVHMAAEYAGFDTAAQIFDIKPNVPILGPNSIDYDEESQHADYDEEPQQPDYDKEPQQLDYDEEPLQPDYDEEPQQPDYDEEPQQPDYDEEPLQPDYDEDANTLPYDAKTTGIASTQHSDEQSTSSETPSLQGTTKQSTTANLSDTQDPDKQSTMPERPRTQRLEIQSPTPGLQRSQQTAKQTPIPSAPIPQKIEVQSAIPTLGDWPTLYGNLRQSIISNKNWTIQLPATTTKKIPNAFKIIPKNTNLAAQPENHIHVNYDPLTKTVKFHINALQPNDYVILQMLTSAQKCGNILTINGTNAELIKRTIELAYQHNIPNIKIAENALALLKSKEKDDPTYNKVIQKVESLRPTFKT